MALTKISRGLLNTGVSDGSDATAITIDSSEQVGIGTTSPNAGLEVLKAGGGKIRISETASRYVEIIGYAEGSANGSTMAFQTVQTGTSTSTERMRINHSGEVGIGTTSPDSLLHVDGSKDGPLVTLHQTGGASSNYRGLDVETSSTGTTVQRWLNSGTELMRVTGTGNVGIGVTSPDQKLMVKGTIETEATNSTNGWHIYTYTDNTLRFNYNGVGSDELIIDSSGNHTRYNHPIFMADEPAATAGDANNVIIFGGEDHDQGGHYNTSNGRFTAPTGGRYFFTVSVLFDPDNTGNSHYARLTFRVNGSGSTKYAESLNSAFATDAGTNSTTSNYQSLSMSTIITLAANDFVDVTNSGTMPTYGTNYGSFAGFLVG